MPEGESGAGPVLSWAELDDEALVPGFVAQAVCDGLVVGGASRTVLGSVTLPVWMAH